MEIIRVVIKGASGYGFVDDAYEDKVTLTSSSISYEYKPHPLSQLETNTCRKWTYKTNAPTFKDIFDMVAAETPKYLHSDIESSALDIGPIDVIVTYEDKHKDFLHLLCPSEYFADYFRLIKKLVPSCEDTPVVLQTQEDYELID